MKYIIDTFNVSYVELTLIYDLQPDYKEGRIVRKYFQYKQITMAISETKH
jgi:hypothetical protein